MCPCKRLMRARFRLGMFDPPEMVKYAQIPYSENDSPAHSATGSRNRAQVDRASEERSPYAAPEQIAQDGRRDRPQCRRYRRAAGQLQRHLHRAHHASGGHPPQARRKNESDLRPRQRSRGRRAELRNVPATALSISKASTTPSCDFDGKPHRPRQRTDPKTSRQRLKPLFTRADPQIDFEWWEGSPREDLNADDFGVLGPATSPRPSRHLSIGAIGMNAFELSIDDKQIVTYNNIHEGAYRYAAVELKAGAALSHPPRLSRIFERCEHQTGVVAPHHRHLPAARSPPPNRPTRWSWCSGSRRDSKARK